MINKKIFVLAGTTEGKAIANYLESSNTEAIISVATAYGEDLMPKSGKLTVQCGRLDKVQMIKLLREEQVEVVIDATHPYAVIVTQNVKEACKELGLTYLRVIRPSSQEEGIQLFSTLEEVIAYLNQTEAKVLLTTGSKDLGSFTKVEGYKERLYPRILPMVETVQSALELGYQRNHLICMQGPFTYDFNVGLLKQIQASYLVTKDSGDIGGLEDKLKAAQDLGVTVLMIARPQEEKGYTLEEMIRLLEEMKR